MDRDQVMRWVDGYIDAWRAEDPQGVERLFTEEAHYRRSPYEKSEVGHEAIKAFWLADAGETFAARWSLYRDVLTFQRDPSLGHLPTPYLVKPWRRAG